MKYLFIAVSLILFSACKKETPAKGSNEYSVQLSIEGKSECVWWYKNQERLGFVTHKFHSGDTSKLRLFYQGGGSIPTPYVKLYVDGVIVWEGEGGNKPIPVYIFK